MKHGDITEPSHLGHISISIIIINNNNNNINNNNNN